MDMMMGVPFADVGTPRPAADEAVDDHGIPELTVVGASSGLPGTRHRQNSP